MVTGRAWDARLFLWSEIELLRYEVESDKLEITKY